MRLPSWVGAAMVAAAAALFGVCLTRVFAFLYSANSVFLLTGLAASGLAVGGLVAHRLCWPAARAFGVAAAGAAIAAGLMLATAVFVAGTAAGGWGAANVALAYLAFGAAGVPLAATFAAGPRHAAAIFAAETLGGGAAALLASPLVDRFGPLSAWLVAAVLAAGGAVAFLSGRWVVRRRVPARDEDEIDAEGFNFARAGGWLAAGAGTLGVLLAVAALPLQLSADWLRLDAARANNGKPLYLSIQDEQMRERVVSTRWDSVSRTDVTEPGSTDQVKWAYQDGSVAGLMYRSGNQGAGANLSTDIGNLPFQMPGAHDKVLVIGAGTGEEVLLALAAGAKEVVAAEVSPGLIGAAQQYASFNGDWLSNPAVRLVDQDGRTYLRTSSEQFDIIYLSLSQTGAAQPGGPVTGSYLYTIDAFGDYLDHLRQDGRLVLKLHDEQEFVRAFNTSFQALRRRGGDPVQSLRRLLAVNDQPVADRGDGGIALPLLIVRKTPYLEDEAHAAYDLLQQSPYTPIYIPFLEQQSPFSAIADEQVGPEALEASAPYDIRPVTDASPFFYEFAKGFPWVALLAPLLPLALAGIAALFTRRPSAESIESLSDLPEDALAFLEDDLPWRFVAFAAVAAAGFALAQEALLQRLPLLLGDPRLTLAVGYGAFLLAAAAGSALVSRVGRASLRPAIGWAGLAGGIVAIATIELFPMAAASIRGENVAVQVAAGAAFAIPLGLCFGVPFASAIRLLAGARRGGWAPLLFAVSVLGGTVGAFLALTLGIALSFNYALAAGAVCLFAVFMMAGLRYIRVDEREETLPEPAPAVDHAPFQRPAPAAGAAAVDTADQAETAAELSRPAEQGVVEPRA